MSDFERLQGTWEGAWEAGGHQISYAWLVVTNERATFCGEDYDRITIDPTKECKEVDFWKDDASVLRGIYQLDGDILALYLTSFGRERPRDYNGKDHDFCFLVRKPVGVPGVWLARLPPQ